MKGGEITQGKAVKVDEKCSLSPGCKGLLAVGEGARGREPVPRCL